MTRYRLSYNWERNRRREPHIRIEVATQVAGEFGEYYEVWKVKRRWYGIPRYFRTEHDAHEHMRPRGSQEIWEPSVTVHRVDSK